MMSLALLCFILTATTSISASDPQQDSSSTSSSDTEDTWQQSERLLNSSNITMHEYHNRTHNHRQFDGAFLLRSFTIQTCLRLINKYSLVEFLYSNYIQNVSFHAVMRNTLAKITSDHQLRGQRQNERKCNHVHINETTEIWQLTEYINHPIISDLFLCSKVETQIRIQSYWHCVDDLTDLHNEATVTYHYDKHLIPTTFRLYSYINGHKQTKDGGAKHKEGIGRNYGRKRVYASTN